MKIADKSKIERDTQELSQAYAVVFDNKNPMVQKVLADLMRFCRARESTFHVDQRAHALMEGRREVWLRLDLFATHTPEEIVAKITRPIDPIPNPNR